MISRLSSLSSLTAVLTVEGAPGVYVGVDGVVAARRRCAGGSGGSSVGVRGLVRGVVVVLRNGAARIGA